MKINVAGLLVPCGLPFPKNPQIRLWLCKEVWASHPRRGQRSVSFCNQMPVLEKAPPPPVADVQLVFVQSAGCKSSLCCAGSPWCDAAIALCVNSIGQSKQRQMLEQLITGGSSLGSAGGPSPSLICLHRSERRVTVEVRRG